jgi:aminomethyltransferase
MGLKTPLYATHVEQGAKIVDFGGWDMPLHYGSQVDEHHAVRRDAGLFDVSHMCSIDLRGRGAGEFLRKLLANDVAKLKAPGKGLYSCMLREDGGVIDDLIVYRMTESWFRMVVNAGTRDKDLAWIRAGAEPHDVAVEAREDLAMIAVQGPCARAKAASVLSESERRIALDLKPFTAAPLGAWLIARTGYTGEDGFEIALPAADAPTLWKSLCARSIVPAGLGARDTLRLEAGMCLYGSDLDESHHPLESGLAWTVAFEPPDRDFFGRAALERVNRPPREELVGLLLQGRGVLRRHQTVITARGAGEITSGTFSPTLNRSIALARVPHGASGTVQVEVRGNRLGALVVKPPFVRHGAALISTTQMENNS